MKKALLLFSFFLLCTLPIIAQYDQLEYTCREVTSECPIDCGNGVIMTKLYVSGNYVIYDYQSTSSHVKNIRSNKASYKKSLEEIVRDPDNLPFINLVVKANKGICFRTGVKGSSSDYIDIVFSSSEVKNLVKK